MHDDTETRRERIAYGLSSLILLVVTFFWVLEVTV